VPKLIPGLAAAVNVLHK